MLDSAPFIEDISEEAFGPDLWDDYTSVIETPINLPMIKARMIARDYYLHPFHFIDEVSLCFQNAIKFNKKGTPYYKAAQTMKKDMDRLFKEYDMISE